jgi:hypothetical protein
MANTKITSNVIADGAITESKLASGVGGVAGIVSNADATAITIDSSENVGIGTTSPVVGLHVTRGGSGLPATSGTAQANGTLRLSSLATSGVIDFGMNSSNPWIQATDSGGLNNNYNLNLNPNGGNVGIGTTSPASLLDVRGGNIYVDGGGSGGASQVILTTSASSGANFGQISNTGTRWSLGYGGSIGTVGTEVLTWNSSGRVGIGTTSPSGEFHVDSGLAPCDIHFTTGSTGGTGYDVNLNLTGGANNAEMNINMGIAGNADREQIKTYQSTMRFITSDTERIRITSGGLITAGTSASDIGNNIRNWTERGYIELSGDLTGYAAGGYTVLKSSGTYIYFDVNGSYAAYLNSSGTLTPSDERLKENVTSLTNSLSKVQQLRGVNFTWINQDRGTGNNIGFIAQEVEEIFPELVGDGGLPNDENNEAPMKAVNYEKLVPVLVESIKELKLELDAAKSRIETLENA